MPEAVSVSLPSRGTLLGFDFGLSRIGIATGELETSHASALSVIEEESNSKRFSVINQIIDEWQPVALVVGIPSYLDGTEHALTLRCRRFANQLRGRTHLPVFESDERLSSVAAETELIAADKHHWHQRKPLLDAVAAQIILQQFLDNLRHESTGC